MSNWDNYQNTGYGNQPPQNYGSNNAQPKKEDLSLGGAWEARDRNGNQYFSIKFSNQISEEAKRLFFEAIKGNGSVMMFSNNYKEPGSKQPDFRLVCSKPRE